MSPRKRECFIEIPPDPVHPTDNLEQVHAGLLVVFMLEARERPGRCVSARGDV